MAHDAATLTCKDVVELVTEFLGDTLDPAERVRIEQHLLVCPPCTLHLSQMRATIEFSSMLRSDSATIEPNQELVARLRERSRK